MKALGSRVSGEPEAVRIEGNEIEIVPMLKTKDCRSLIDYERTKVP